MSNKTFIPAFKAKVGDWPYYICTMKYAEVARQVSFAYELGGNSALSTMIQRGISQRTKDITDYLLRSRHRFLGALIIAVWGGDPNYIPIQMDDPDGMLAGLDRGFGVLTFDGTQQYFALDGQHRLKAIKDALKKRPELGREDICILMVSHYDSDEGKQRTRRLFTNINRNAKTTTRGENIALDVDDGIAILTRMLLTDHPFLSQDDVVRVFTRVGADGDIRLAPPGVPKGNKNALTSISVLYDVVKNLLHELDESLGRPEIRPSDEVLENSYTKVAARIDDLLLHCGEVRKRMEAAKSARDVRAPKGRECSGHPFMRPVIQKAVARVIQQIIEQDALPWDEVMHRLSELEWKIGKAPWLAVFNPDSGKMVSGKDFTNLLDQLLIVHLAPQSKSEVRRARQNYKSLLNVAYPVSEADLNKRVVAAPAPDSTVAKDA